MKLLKENAFQQVSCQRTNQNQWKHKLLYSQLCHATLRRRSGQNWYLYRFKNGCVVYKYTYPPFMITVTWSKRLHCCSAGCYQVPIFSEMLPWAHCVLVYCMDLLPPKFPLSNHVYMDGNQYRIICISCKYSSTFNLGRGRVGVPALLVVYLFSIISPYCHDYGVKKARKRRTADSNDATVGVFAFEVAAKQKGIIRSVLSHCINSPQ